MIFLQNITAAKTMDPKPILKQKDQDFLSKVSKRNITTN